MNPLEMALADLTRFDGLDTESDDPICRALKRKMRDRGTALRRELRRRMAPMGSPAEVHVGYAGDLQREAEMLLQHDSDWVLWCRFAADIDQVDELLDALPDDVNLLDGGGP